MDDIPIGALLGILAALLILSAFFSASETGLMSLNRYRLRHLARSGNRGAILTERLLQRPDRLLGLILLGNNFVNILASSLATIIALRIGGEAAIAIGALLLTILVLVFSEVAPKTLAALRPERIAYPAAFIYTPLLKLLYPIVWAVNGIANGLLFILGVRLGGTGAQSLSRDELRTVVLEAGVMIPKRHQGMLLSILDLEKATVEDIMVPRNEITGIDLDEKWSDILDQLMNSQHTRLPVYVDSIDDIIGVIHVRQLLRHVGDAALDRDTLRGLAREPYFIPESTSLYRQLLNFQTARRRIGLVVDEYGDIQGLVTLEDILEEVVGEFTTDPAAQHKDVFAQEDGSFLVNGSASIRALNRTMSWHLPTNGPKTLNGLILEYLEDIPQKGTSLKLSGHPIEIVQTTDNAVKIARVRPAVAEDKEVVR